MRQLFVVLALASACGVGAGSQRYPDSILLSKDDLELAARPLSNAEAKVVSDVGFAVLERRETRSFHVGYTTIFHAHAPVYVTADSLLYAWHASYDDILKTVE